MAETHVCTMEESQLILRAQHGDESALEQIIERYRPLIRASAKRSTIYLHAELADDLIQAGTIGLLKAVARFSFDGGAKLSTYALPWILGEIRQAIRLSSDESGIEAGKSKVERMQDDLLLKLRRTPTLKELAQACGMTPEQVCELSTLSMRNADSEKDGHALQSEWIRDNHEKTLEAAELSIAIQSLTDEERTIIVLRYFKDLTQKETAALLRLSQTQISRLERKALDSLKKYLS